ncbi:hypothetical protein Z948_2834 [Sulfitobacter donghicola DSW-25 = KCTC 12864 = JCM 14565]|nr:hypothetical protein Z948_2834 [Sulfitobacter donghicola DSW-25 = KCTC 12864 = JCM 14565]
MSRSSLMPMACSFVFSGEDGYRRKVWKASFCQIAEEHGPE